MRIFQANGIFTSERGYFWDNHFNLTSLIFVGILILLIWGIFAWFQDKKKQNTKNNQNVKNNVGEEQTGNCYRYNREYEQAKLREEALFDDDGDIDGIPSVIEQITKEQNEIDHKNS